ncbi:hypothetical protein Tco_1549717, partial [Tanacetum coccineum]
LEILTSHLKTARAPLKAHTCAPLEPAWKAEIDREGLGTHQWKTGEHGANLTRSAVPKGKEVLEHFGVQLEDTTKYPSEPTQVHYMEKQQKFYTVPSSSKVKEEYASSTSSEQRLGSNEKGTEIGIRPKAIKEGKSRTDRFLYEKDIRRLQRHVERQDEGSHAV